MLKKLKWYYKIIIIFIIMLIMYSCTNKGFIINVKAEEVPNFYFHVPDSENMRTFYNQSLITNFAYNVDFESDNIHYSRSDTLLNNESITGNTTYNRIWSRNYILDNDDFTLLQTRSIAGYNLNNIINVNYTGSNSNVVYYGSYLTSFIYGESNNADYNHGMRNLIIEKGKTYEVAFEIKKSNDSHFRDNLGELTIDNFFLYFYYNTTSYPHTNTNTLFTKDYADILDFKYFVYADNNEHDNYAFIKIRFKLKDRMVGDNTTSYNSTDSFTLHGIGANIGTFNQYTDRRSFIMKLKTSTSPSTLNYTISRVILLENGYISFAPGYDDPNYDNSNLDNVSLNDMSIFDRLDSCSTTDIGCHVNNILTMIKNLFVRIGNMVSNLFNNISTFLQSLFVPNYSDISTMFSDMKTAFLNKLGFIRDSIDILSDFVDNVREQTINTNFTITLPPIKEYFTDTIIWSGGEYNLKYYMTYGALGTLYTIYYLFVGAYFIFLFINFCIDSLDDILAGRIGGSQTLSMLQDTMDDNANYEPKHVYQPKHVDSSSMYRHFRDRRH